MKKIFILVLLLFVPGFYASLFSQQQADPLQFMQGLKQGENVFF